MYFLLLTIILLGFFNAFIYARPRYQRIRKTKGGKLTFWETLKLVFLPDRGVGASVLSNFNNNSSTVVVDNANTTTPSAEMTMTRRQEGIPLEPMNKVNNDDEQCISVESGQEDVLEETERETLDSSHP
jgi:hypothetical protein